MNPKLNDFLKKVMKKLTKKQREDVIAALQAEHKEKIEKAEVLTLADVEAALDQELFAVVLQAIEAAGMAAQQAPAPEKQEPEEEEEVEPEKADDDDTDTEKKLKAELAKQRKENEAERKKNEELAARFAKMEEEAAFEKKLAVVEKGVFKMLPGKNADIAKALLKLEKQGDWGKSVIELLERTAKALAESGIFKTHGSGQGNDNPEEKTATQTFNEMAKKLAEEKDIAITSAKALLIKSNPDLYDKLKEEQEAQN